eukprot:132503-Ditylum_brightwellii.AAC.1
MTIIISTLVLALCAKPLFVPLSYYNSGNNDNVIEEENVKHDKGKREDARNWRKGIYAFELLVAMNVLI